MTRHRENPGASGIQTPGSSALEADALTTRPTRQYCVEETTVRLVYCDSFLPITAVAMQFLLLAREKEVRCHYKTLTTIEKTYQKLVQILQAEYAVTSYPVDGPDWVEVARCPCNMLNGSSGRDLHKKKKTQRDLPPPQKNKQQQQQQQQQTPPPKKKTQKTKQTKTRAATLW